MACIFKEVLQWTDDKPTGCVTLQYSKGPNTENATAAQLVLLKGKITDLLIYKMGHIGHVNSI